MLETLQTKSFHNIFIYTENTLNRIETFKLTVYNTKHTQHIKIHFSKTRCLQKYLFGNSDVHWNQRFLLIFMARLEAVLVFCFFNCFQTLNGRVVPRFRAPCPLPPMAPKGSGRVSQSHPVLALTPRSA